MKIDKEYKNILTLAITGFTMLIFMVILEDCSSVAEAIRVSIGIMAFSLLWVIVLSFVSYIMSLIFNKLAAWLVSRESMKKEQEE